MDANDELGLALQAIQDAWTQGAAPPPQLPGSPENQEKLARILADLLSAQSFALAIAKGDLTPSLKAQGLMAGSLKEARDQLERREHELLQANARLLAEAAERKQVEEKLGESEELYRLITDNMSDTVWLMDTSLTTTFISPSVVRARGYTLEELRALPLDQQVIPASLDTLLQVVGQELTPDKPARQDLEISKMLALEFCRKDGSTFWGEVRITLLRDSQGQPIGFLGIGRDVTERKRIEEALQESETRFCQLVEQLPVFVYRGATEDSRLGYASPRIKLLLGITPEEWIADPTGTWIEHLHPDDRDRAWTADRRSHATGEPFREEYRLVARDGRVVWVRDEAVIVRDAAGQKLDLHGIMLDMRNSPSGMGWTPRVKGYSPGKPNCRSSTGASSGT